MTLEQAYEYRRKENLQLQNENRKLQKKLDQLAVGTYTNEEKAQNIRTINRLTQENQHLKNQLERYKDLYHRQVIITENFDAKAMDSVFDQEDMAKELVEYKKKCAELQSRMDAILGTNNDASDSESDELRAQVEALKDALAKEKAKNNTDGTNSSLPTSQTPIGKKKVIPNSRVKSGKKRGGQPGHKKHTLTPLSESEITDREKHTFKNCPDCGSDDLTLIEKRTKDVIDYEVKLVKKRHYIYVYKCNSCGHVVHSPIPLSIKEPVQYGNVLQAMCLALLDLGYVSINRVKKIVDGFLENRISISEGYISKLQKRASRGLRQFMIDLKLECIKQKILHWDDTVIFVDTKRCCVRFYGNEHIAMFVAHKKKDRKSLDEDGILAALGSDTTVVHDHVTVNYNKDFHFKNAECSGHLSRDMQKIVDYSDHPWAKELKDYLAGILHERNILVENGVESFGTRYYTIMGEIDRILKRADEQFATSKGKYYESDERKLINRLRKFKKSNFLWIKDFSVPPTNNLAERSLRGIKVKQKVSGQYQDIKNAGFFADVKSYIDTCSRNNVPPFQALTRLMEGNPYTLKEILGGA